ncbi:hypothetical protein BDV27DRAFT_146717 [Aspergillus caelatus]|uniref:Uncharacterized protein n=1 Tax=Aspergillus caelatus TaxID=61420 RepID=A0A5N6ZZG0_9EURO|nr:uncharacterized protein BDV27DRAFT_146717 [Aspergillus caelatus]KAE8362708.1 hypothetical protein BDV27DRAFT_146717 [Aspergillus caelatus]
MPHRPSIGLLLYYTNERVESLGQVHWGLDLTHDALAPIYTSYTWLESEASTLQKTPQLGTLVWWFGDLGDKVVIYTDPEL